MRSRLLLPLILAALAVSAAAPAQAAEAPRLFAPAELREDFAVLRQSLEEGDPGLYRFIARPDLDGVFDRTERSLDHPMDELGFYRLAARAVAAIRNGHTQLQLSEPTAGRYQQTVPLLPLGIRVIGGHAFVLRDLSGHGLAGSEITAVDGRPMAGVLADLRGRLSLDGNVTGSRDRDSGGWRLLYDLAQSHPAGTPYALTVARQGKRQRLSLPGLDGKALVAAWRKAHPDDSEVARSAKAKLEVRPNGVAIITLRHWDYQEDGKPGLSEDFKAWFAELERQKPRALVIDIRDNGGGDETMSTELLSYLFDHPFHYYDCVVLKAQTYKAFAHLAPDADPYATELPKYEAPARGHCATLAGFEMTNRPNLGLQQPRGPGWRGPVYVLINAASFSTSAEFAAHIKSSGRGVLIGEETSGAYYGNVSGMMLPVVLPHTGLRLADPLIRYDLAVKPDQPPGAGVRPDVAIAPAIADLIAGADKPMAAALRLAAAHHP